MSRSPRPRAPGRLAGRQAQKRRLRTQARRQAGRSASGQGDAAAGMSVRRRSGWPSRPSPRRRLRTPSSLCGRGRGRPSARGAALVAKPLKSTRAAGIMAAVAEVVELADTRCSGRRRRMPVWVRVPPSAPGSSGWRNWQTHTFEGRMGQPVGVRVPLPTPFGPDSEGAARHPRRGGWRARRMCRPSAAGHARPWGGRTHAAPTAPAAALAARSLTPRSGRRRVARRRGGPGASRVRGRSAALARRRHGHPRSGRGRPDRRTGPSPRRRAAP